MSTKTNLMALADTKKFMSYCPTLLDSMTNQLGQRVEFYEHPTLGDSAPVYAKIDNIVANTGFYDLGDFFMQEEVPVLDGTSIVIDSEYNPVLHNGEVMCHGEYEDLVSLSSFEPERYHVQPESVYDYLPDY